MPFNRLVLCAATILWGLAGCALAPGQGPLQAELLKQATENGRPRFDVVEVDDRVVAALQAQKPPPFHSHFKKYQPPPQLPIAVGDVLSVVIWESSPEGLFGASTDIHLDPAEIAEALRSDPEAAALIHPSEAPLQRDAAIAALRRTAQGQYLLQTLEQVGRPETHIPDQRVGVDGGITIPYAGRIPAAGHTPAEVQHLIEARLAGKALDPQALVLVKHSDVNTVTVSGELVAGALVPLDVGGSRLLEVIAAAGGARAPVHDTYVSLSRDGLTATVPLATLVDDPDEDIFARPGDVVTLQRRPQVLSVFGAAGKNAAVQFDQDRVSLGEALGKAAGLRDSRADPRAVFLLRYEPAAVARAVGAQPLPDAAAGGLTPVAYRLDLSDAKSFNLAQRFPVRDNDVIYIAEAPSEPLRKVLSVFQNITGPLLNAVLICHQTKC